MQCSACGGLMRSCGFHHRRSHSLEKICFPDFICYGLCWAAKPLTNCVILKDEMQRVASFSVLETKKISFAEYACESTCLILQCVKWNNLFIQRLWNKKWPNERHGKCHAQDSSLRLGDLTHPSQCFLCCSEKHFFKQIFYYFTWSSPVHPYFLNSYIFPAILHKQMLASERNETLDFHDIWKGLQNTLPEGIWAIVSGSHNELAWELFKRQLK